MWKDYYLEHGRRLDLQLPDPVPIARTSEDSNLLRILVVLQLTLRFQSRNRCYLDLPLRTVNLAIPQAQGQVPKHPQGVALGSCLNGSHTREPIPIAVNPLIAIHSSFPCASPFLPTRLVHRRLPALNCDTRHRSAHHTHLHKQIVHSSSNKFAGLSSVTHPYPNTPCAANCTRRYSPFHGLSIVLNSPARPLTILQHLGTISGARNRLAPTVSSQRLISNARGPT